MRWLQGKKRLGSYLISVWYDSSMVSQCSWSTEAKIWNNLKVLCNPTSLSASLGSSHYHPLSSKTQQCSFSPHGPFFAYTVSFSYYFPSSWQLILIHAFLKKIISLNIIFREDLPGQFSHLTPDRVMPPDTMFLEHLVVFVQSS